MKSFLFTFFIACSLGAFANEAGSANKSPVVKTAVFAGGCFWCMQPPFEDLKNKGVLSAIVGYAGGHKENPTYEQVSAGKTGHLEVIQVTYDENKISLKELLAVYWKNIDPYDKEGQFCDKGESYKSAVFYSGEAEKKTIEDSIKDLEKFGVLESKIATQILPQKNFYKAEDYHQSYYEKNPIRYKFYRSRCGRDKRLKEVWGLR